MNKHGNRFVDLTGRHFGELSVIELAKVKNKKAMWLCRCSCGKVKAIRGTHLTYSGVTTCGGSWHRDPASFVSNLVHGLSKHPLYSIWHAMHQRCYYTKNCKYSCYGSRGIKVCKRWHGSEGLKNFIADMGMPPAPKMQINRIDNNGNYSPDNCEWTTAKKNMSNRQNTVYFEYQGRSVPLPELAELAGITAKEMWRRLVQRKWTVDRAVNQPLKKVRRKT